MRLHGGKTLANRVEVVVRDFRVDGIVRARCVLDETRVRRAVLDLDFEGRRDIDAMCCHNACSFRSWEVIPGRWYSIEGLASGPVREAGGRAVAWGDSLALISLCRKCVSIASVTFDGQIMPACLCLRLGRGNVDHRHSEVVGFRIVVGVQEVVEEKMCAIGDAVTEDGGILVDELDVLIVVDEACLDKDGGHGRAAQDGELRMDLDAAVREGLVDAADVAVQRVLHVMGQNVAPRSIMVAVSLAAAAAAGVGMDGKEEVGRPVVRKARDIWIGGRFAAQVVALHDFYRIAVTLQGNGAVFRNHGVAFRFGDAEFFVDGAGVRMTVERMAWIDEDVHKNSPFIHTFSIFLKIKNINSRSNHCPGQPTQRCTARPAQD